MSGEITVIGGGIAAAAAILALGEEGRRARVIAPPPSAGERIGEVLSPAARPILEKLGLGPAFREEGHRPAHATFSAWGSPILAERNAILHPGGPGWLLDRARFERFLWDRALAAGVERLEGTVSAVRHTAGGWRLDLRGGGSLDCRFLIDCSGRTAVAARKLGRPYRDDRLVAAFAFLEHVDPEVRPTPAVLIEARPDGWWYSALVPDGRLALVYFSDADLMPRGLASDAAQWRALIEATELTRKRIETAGFAPGGPPRLTGASGTGVEPVAGDGWAAAGDAAAAFDPLSSHGITTALWCGREVALAACAFLRGDPVPLRRYVRAVAGGLARYRQSHREIYGMERRFAERPFWSRRQRRVSGP